MQVDCQCIRYRPTYWNNCSRREQLASAKGVCVSRDGEKPAHTEGHIAHVLVEIVSPAISAWNVSQGLQSLTDTILLKLLGVYIQLCLTGLLLLVATTFFYWNISIQGDSEVGNTRANRGIGQCDDDINENYCLVHVVITNPVIFCLLSHFVRHDNRFHNCNMFLFLVNSPASEF